MTTEWMTTDYNKLLARAYLQYDARCRMCCDLQINYKQKLTYIVINMLTIQEHHKNPPLQKILAQIINRILSNKSHAVTSAIPRTKARSGRLETFKTNKARTSKYANSILQAHLSPVSDLYTRNSAKTASPLAQPAPLAKPKTKCPVCGKPFIHLSKHLAKSKCKQ